MNLQNYWQILTGLFEEDDLTIQSEGYIRHTREIYHDITITLDGMDYCLDWKQNPNQWSARETIYHLIDTPKGGIHSAVTNILEGRISIFAIDTGLTNLDSRRRSKDIKGLLKDVEGVLDDLKQIMKSTDDATLAAKRAPLYSVRVGITQEYNVHTIVQTTFVDHWHHHLEHLRQLRAMLGIE